MSADPFRYEDDEDPFASALDDALGQSEPPPAPWTIERGNAHDSDTSPEAQGRRAAKCASRVRPARAVPKLPYRMIHAENAEHGAAVAEAQPRPAGSGGRQGRLRRHMTHRARHSHVAEQRVAPGDFAADGVRRFGADHPGEQFRRRDLRQRI